MSQKITLQQLMLYTPIYMALCSFLSYHEEHLPVPPELDEAAPLLLDAFEKLSPDLQKQMEQLAIACIERRQSLSKEGLNTAIKMANIVIGAPDEKTP